MMRPKLIAFIIIGGIVFAAAGLGIWLHWHGTGAAGALHSPYAGQQAAAIKALSLQDIEGLRSGAGTPFGGMAKPAELNGYPGPRHVLDAYAAGVFDLDEKQHRQIEMLYQDMQAGAVPLGEKIIASEQAIDDGFSNKTINRERLQKYISESTALYGRLRLHHLQYHLAMVDILTPQQVEKYNALRGYGSGNPCDNIPPGHEPALWKLHNHCE